MEELVKRARELDIDIEDLIIYSDFKERFI